MSEDSKLARIFKALSVETRIRIVKILKHQALCVGALSVRLGVTQGAVSQHLRILRDLDLIVPEKRGYFVHYRLNERTLEKWKKTVERLLGREVGTAASSFREDLKKKGEGPCARERAPARNQRS